MPPQAERLTLSVAEAALLTGFSQHAIRRAIRDKTLPSLTIGRLVRVPRQPLLALLGASADHDTQPRRST
jgi:excisionase family DNA binding protein